MSALDFYDRQGNPITLDEWSRLHSDFDYRMLISTVVGEKRVSTVWLGTDHGWPGEPGPVIFETMVFPANGPLDDEACYRYITEEEAIKDHHRIVAELMPPPAHVMEAAARRAALIARELEQKGD